MTATLYHISPSTGRPNICTATKRGCPLGDDTGHYPSKEEARKAYEQQQKGSELPSVAKKPIAANEQEWYEKPLTETEEARRASLASVQYLIDPKDKEELRGLATRAKWAGTETEPKRWAPVPTDYELDQMENNLHDQLYGYTVASLVQARNISEKDVYEAEDEWGGYVETKVPSYYEISISSDLVRRTLGMKPRPKTAADRTPMRAAQLELNEAERKLYGVHSDPESYRAINEAHKAAQAKVKALRDEAVIASVRQAMVVSEKVGAKGNYTSVTNSHGREVGTMVPSPNGTFSVAVKKPGFRGEETKHVGVFSSAEEGLQALASDVRFTFNY